MNASGVFALIVAGRCDYQCPAVQDAIDRLVEGEAFGTRVRMLEVLRSNAYTPLKFNFSLLSAWKAKDIELVTGHAVDWWIELADRMRS